MNALKVTLLIFVLLSLGYKQSMDHMEISSLRAQVHNLEDERKIDLKEQDQSAQIQKSRWQECRDRLDQQALIIKVLIARADLQEWVGPKDFDPASIKQCFRAVLAADQDLREWNEAHGIIP